ncbi:MAG: aldehyde dehydrogenase family protein, partial [Burkholderiales bacterium]
LSTLGIQKDNMGASTGTTWLDADGARLVSHSPVDGNEIATIHTTDRATYDTVVGKAASAFEEWRSWPPLSG